ncbi:MAG: ATP-binding protein [Candidatus Limnocylindria bacterium]
MTATHRLATDFARRVRTLRAAAGLTQAELAERAGISERTVSDLERGLRSTVYPATARRLARSLGVEGHELAAFLTAARGADLEIGPIPSDHRSRMPVPLTRLLGREQEIASALAWLRDPAMRLVTLVGPGGIGKTRLAIEVASAVQAGFPGGVVVASLADADDPNLVLPLIAAALGLSAGVADVPRLPGGRTLVVLDTMEHRVEAAPAIARLLEACPDLVALATSRIPLRIRGEHEVQVPPLPPSPAVSLFLERAQAVGFSSDGSPATNELLADICARVDRVPLAIELAAARVKHTSLEGLRNQLEHRLEPLAGGPRDLPARQQTMRGTHDWSYALLGPGEMRTFRALAPFRGSFERQAAEAVAEKDVLASLTALVDCSLVQSTPGAEGETRYRLLDITREYAVERSSAAGELSTLRRRHAAYFLALAERMEPELRGKEQQRWYIRLREDEANFRAALAFALEAGDGQTALRLAGSLWMFWRWAGQFTEGRAWLDASLAAAEDAPPDARCQGLWGAGWLAFHAADYRRTGELGVEMLRLLEGRDDALTRRKALTLIGNAALGERRDEIAIAALTQALGACEHLGAGWHLATSLLNLGTAEVLTGRAAEALAHLERALAIYRELGDQQFTARALVQLGFTKLAADDPSAAAADIAEAMATFAKLGDGWSITEGLEAVAALRSESDPRSAALLGGAAERLRERIGVRQHPADAVTIESRLERARSRMTDAAFEEAWNEGRRLAPESAASLALV